MNYKYHLHPSGSRPGHAGRAAIWLTLSLLLTLALLAACEGSPSPNDPSPSGGPSAQPTARPTARPGTQPAETLTVAPYPPETPQPGYPVATTPAATPVPSQAPNQTGGPAGPFSWFLPYVGAEIVTPEPPTETAKPRAPEPSDTPRPTWPDPLSGQTTSKLGLHIIAVYPDPDILEFVQRVRPRVVMSPYDQAGLAQLKAASPSTITISRFDVKGQEEWIRTVPDAAAAADHYVQANLAKYRENPTIDYWEGINEFNPQTPEDWQWFAAYEGARACAMQAQGLHAAIGAFAVGYPRTFDEMNLFLPALEAAHRCGAILTIHEYNGPTMDCGVSTNVPNIIPGAPAINVPAGYLTLRYRILYEGLLKPRGLGDLPLVITELGADGGSAKEGCGMPGQGWTWKKYAPFWVQQGIAPTNGEAYVNVLAWYDNEIKKDPYVIGATIFTTGEFASTAWARFDIHDALRQLAAYEVRP